MQSSQMQSSSKKILQATTQTNIVPLKSSDFAIATEYLASAFSQDPLVGHFLPEDGVAKQKILTDPCRSFLGMARSYGHIYTTAETPKGVAIWLPPEAFPMTWSAQWAMLMSGFGNALFRLGWKRAGEFLSLMKTEMDLHEQFAHEPHWYLGMLGVAPECQGQGIGGMLLQPILAKADSEQLPCYLETTTPGAVRFYQRNGFEIVHHMALCGSDFWLMKRLPRNVETV